jgi:hypothetical protein
MKRADLPAAVLAKLLVLDDQAQDLARKVADAERGITSARAGLTGGFQRQSEYDDLYTTLKQLVADKPILERKQHALQCTLSSCKSWLDGLPENTVLEPVEVEVNGDDVAAVRARIKTAEDELRALRAVPVPAPDIQQKIEDYVRSMARPKVSGVGNGEKLDVDWPNNNVVSMMALLHGEAMVEVLMKEVDRTANSPMPPAARQKRITKL